jgi:exonuclease III
MTFYPAIKSFDEETRKRTASRLLALRKQISEEIPTRNLKDNLLIATWNIRDFDSNKFGHGPRINESFHYIAEVISAFDIVAIQEINDDMSALKRVMRILGPSWDYFVSDTVEGPGGNGERMAMVYDRRKVSFRNIAGEVVLPKSKLVLKDLQFARTPYLVAFQAGWFKFQLCTVHIYYGDASDSSAKMKRRVAEIDSVAKFLAKRAKKKGNNYILLGDFNIVDQKHKTMEALKKHKFFVPEQLGPSNMLKDKYYDQIAFKVRKNELEMPAGGAGVFDFYKTVFNEDDFKSYKGLLPADKKGSGVTKHKKYFTNKWRTFQMSDHLPMWVELKIDFSDQYLENLME